MTIKGNSIKPHLKNGGVAQLGEHLPCKQGVMGSIPIISTTGKLPEPNSMLESANNYRDGGSKCEQQRGKRKTGEEKTRYTEELTWAHSSGG